MNTLPTGHLRPFALCKLSACIAIAFPLASTGALAQSTFEASGAYSIGVDQVYFTSQPKSGSFAAPAQAGVVFLRTDGFAADYRDSSASLVANALGDGRFGGSVTTAESYGSQSAMTSNLKMVYRDQIINTTATAQQASFALAISQLRFGFDYGTQRGVNRVDFAASVYRDGSSTPLWSSSFSYDDGPSETTGRGSYRVTGADLGLATVLPAACDYGTSNAHCAFYSGSFGISDYQAAVELGSVAASESVAIRYEVDLSTETDMYGGGASVFFNDPSQLNFRSPLAGRLAFDAITDPGTDGASVAAVPEPETYALMAAGLGALAVATRRRRGR